MQQRAQKLNEHSTALWGKMNAAQMLMHCTKPMLVATGELKTSTGLMGLLMGGYFKKKFLNGGSFGKNLPTLPAFKTDAVEVSLAEAQSLYQQAIQRFVAAEKQGLLSKKHPFFGKMSAADWGTLLYMHTNHHLNQFGV